MQVPETSFDKWCEHYATDEHCAVALAHLRWPNGFQCPHCGHTHGWYHTARKRYECAHCHRQTSVTAGTLFHRSHLPLTKWFWAMYWVGIDKGSISALRLSKLIGVAWRSAYQLLRKLRVAMAHQDSLYRLTTLIEIDDAYIGANKTGKAGRGGGRAPVLVAIETDEDGKPGFVAIEAIGTLNKANVADFAMRRLQPGAVTHTDAYSALRGVAAQTIHVPKITPPELADDWLPWVHLVISNLKRFLLGTYHGAVRPHRLQEYLDEFVYRFNRRRWESQIPNRLLRLCVRHRQVDLRGT